MPASRIRSSTARSSSTVAPTQVKCAIASRPWSALMPADDVDRLAALGGRAARAVGHRDERRLQPRELGERGVEVRLALVGLGREELEREGRLGPARDPFVDAHRARSLRGGAPSAPRDLRHPMGCAPPVRGLRDGRSQARVIVISQLAISSVEGLAVDGARGLVRGSFAPPSSASRDRRELASRPASRLASMWPWTSVNGRAWPASASRASSASTTSSESQELADRVRRVADVEVLRDAAEQVVAGDQQALLGLVQADVRGRVTGRLDHVPGAGVGLDRHAGDEVAVGVAACPPGRSRGRGGASGPALQRLLRDAAEQRDLDRRSRSSGLRVQLPVRVHPHLAAGALGERRRLAAVVDVGVGDDDQLDVARRAWPIWSSAPLEVPHRAAVVHARCPRARSRRRPRAPRRCSAGRRAGRAAGAAARRRGSTRSPRPTSRVRVGLRTARHATVPAMAKKGRRRERVRAPESEYRDEHGSLLVLRGALTPATRAPVRRGRGREHPLPRGRLAARPSSSCSSGSSCAGRSRGPSR